MQHDDDRETAAKTDRCQDEVRRAPGMPEQPRAAADGVDVAVISTRMISPKPERDDGEVVAAQPQRRQPTTARHRRERAPPTSRRDQEQDAGPSERRQAQRRAHARSVRREREYAAT